MTECDGIMECDGTMGGDRIAQENNREWTETVLHLEVASTVQCTTPKTKDKKDATKGACAATW